MQSKETSLRKHFCQRAILFLLLTHGTTLFGSALKQISELMSQHQTVIQNPTTKEEKRLDFNLNPHALAQGNLQISAQVLNFEDLDSHSLTGIWIK